MLAPACRNGNVFAPARFLHTRAVLPHSGLADAITAIQIFSHVDAAELLRSDGDGTGNSGRRHSRQPTERCWLKFLVILQQVCRVPWTAFPDIRTVLSHSCCDICASGWPPMSSSCWR